MLLLATAIGIYKALTYPACSYLQQGYIKFFPIPIYYVHTCINIKPLPILHIRVLTCNRINHVSGPYLSCMFILISGPYLSCIFMLATECIKPLPSLHIHTCNRNTVYLVFTYPLIRVFNMIFRIFLTEDGRYRNKI